MAYMEFSLELGKRSARRGNRPPESAAFAPRGTSPAPDSCDRRSCDEVWNNSDVLKREPLL